MDQTTAFVWAAAIIAIAANIITALALRKLHRERREAREELDALYDSIDIWRMRVCSLQRTAKDWVEVKVSTTIGESSPSASQKARLRRELLAKISNLTDPA